MKTLKENAAARVAELVNYELSNIAALEALKQTLHQFAGKIINKRIDDYFTKIAPTRKRYDGATLPGYYLTFVDCGRIEIRCLDQQNFRRAMTIYNVQNIYNERLTPEKLAALDTEIDKDINYCRNSIQEKQNWVTNFDYAIGKYREVLETLRGLVAYRAMSNYIDLPHDLRDIMRVCL